MDNSVEPEFPTSTSTKEAAESVARPAGKLHSEKLIGYYSIVDESGRHGSGQAENSQRKRGTEIEQPSYNAKLQQISRTLPARRRNAIQ